MNDTFKNFKIQSFEQRDEPSFDYYLDPDTLEINGYTEGIDAFGQAIYLYLNTSLGAWDIFPDDDYGIDYSKFIGKDVYWAIPNLEREIKDAIGIDTRTKGFSDFDWQVMGAKVLCQFTVLSDLGEVDVSTGLDTSSGEVEVNTSGRQ